jgi:nicotinamidase-related amidase
MTAITIDKRPALVLIDLQEGILALPTLLSPDDIKNRARRLATAFRDNALPVVRVKVAWSADGGDFPPGRSLVPGPKSAPPTAYSEFPKDFPPQPGDIILVKRHWGAFTGTELDLQLRRRGVTQIVLAGISTSMGVESTARSAWENSYNLIFAEDAITDVNAGSHTHAFTKIFPQLGEIATTKQIIDTLNSRSASQPGSAGLASAAGLGMAVNPEAGPAVGGSITRTSRGSENAGI